MQIQFATKKVMGAYEVALMVDGKFRRSGAGEDVLSLLVKLAGPILADFDEEGTEIAVNIGVLTPEEMLLIDAHESRARATQIALQEAQDIEKLTAAIKREKDARQAAEAQVGQ